MRRRGSWRGLRGRDDSIHLGPKRLQERLWLFHALVREALAHQISDTTVIRLCADLMLYVSLSFRPCTIFGIIKNQEAICQLDKSQAKYRPDPESTSSGDLVVVQFRTLVR